MKKFALILGFFALCGYVGATTFTILTQPQTLEVVKGNDNLTLPCRVEGDDAKVDMFTIIVVWSKKQDISTDLNAETYESTDINNGGIVSSPFNDKNMFEVQILPVEGKPFAQDINLVLKTITATSVAKYDCAVKNQAGVLASISHTVHVKDDSGTTAELQDKLLSDMSIATPKPPTYTPPLDDTSLTYVQTVPGIFVCRAKGPSKLNMTLTVGGGVQDLGVYQVKNVRDVQGSKGFRTFMYTTTIYHASYEPPYTLNRKMVKCGTPTKSVEKPLRIFFKPIISCPEDVVIKVDHNRVNCTVVSNPLPSSLIWTVQNPDKTNVQKEIDIPHSSSRGNFRVIGDASGDKVNTTLVFENLTPDQVENIKQTLRIEAINDLGTTELRLDITGKVTNSAGAIGYSLLTIMTAAMMVILKL